MILILAGIACLIFAGGVGAMLANVTATPAVSNAASSTSTEPTNQDSSHDLIYANGYYYLFYVTQGYVEYVSSTSMTTWSSPILLISADGVNQGQAFSTYYNATSNVIYLVVAGGGLTSFVIRSTVPTSVGTLGSFTTHTYSDGLGYAMNQPSITFDSLGNTIVTYEGVASGSGVNVVVDRIAHGTTALTTLANVPSLPSGQTANDWDGKVYPYGSGVGSGGAFVLVYSSLHSGGSAPPGTTSVWSYLQDYTGSAWLPVVELTTYQEVTHGNGFTADNAFYYYGQAEVGSEGVFYTHTYDATTPPTQTVIFPHSLGITDGYGSLSWDGQNTIVAYYNSGVEKPYTVWVSVSTNLGSSWTSPAVLATSSVNFAPETLGTNLVIKSGLSNVYWGVQPSSSSSTIQVTTINIALIAPAISVTPTVIDSGQRATLSTTASFSGGTSPYTCQWLAEAPGGNYANLGASYSCKVGDTPTASTGTLSTVGAWSFELQVRDSIGISATSSAVTITANTGLVAPAVSSSSGTIDQGQSSNLTSAAVSTGTSPYTYQWYEEAPSGSFTQIADTNSSSYAFSATGSTATGTWSFELEVVDATSSAVNSSAVTVSVNSALAADAITPSSPAIDSGQSITLTANPSGGTNPYTYQWYSGSSPTCSSDTTALGTAPAQSVSPPSLTYYCYEVSDSAPTPVSLNSATDLIMVNSALGTPFLSPSLPTVDDGQSATIGVSWQGGTPAYTVNLYSGTSSTCSSDTTLISAISGVSGTSTSFSDSPTSNAYYCATVTDSAATPSTTTSSADLVTVNPALVVGAPSGTPPAIDQRQTSSLSATFSGGTSPYTCQWLVEAQGGDTFADFGGSSPCASPNSTSFATTGSTAAGTYTFELQVTDGASDAVASSPGSVTVNAALAIPTVVPSMTTTDDGQSISVAVSWTGGTANYSVNLYSSSTSACPSGPTPVSSQTGLTASPATFTELSPSSTLYYCATVTDSAGTPVAATSSAVQVTVNVALSAGAISPSSPTIDSGQSVAFAANPSGGTTPYSYQWYTSSDCSASPISGATSSTHSASPSSTTTYSVKVTDSAGTPVSACSSGDTVTVSSSLSAGPIAPSAPTIDSGQSIALTANPSGGTNPYYYQWYTGASCTIIVSGQTGASYVASPTSTTTYYYKVSDSAASAASACSSGDTVTVGSRPSVSVSPVTIDYGQTANLTAVVSGGSGGYAYAWYQGAACSGPVLGTSASYTTPAPTSTTGYCIQVTDSLGGTALTTVTPTVNSALLAGAITPSAPSIDSGQTVALTSHESGGSSTFSYQWYTSSDCSAAPIGGAISSTYAASPTTTTTYFYMVTDSASTAEVACSTGDTVTVNPVLGTPAITPSQTVIDSGESVSVQVSWSGGTSTYSIRLYSSTTSNCTAGSTSVGTQTGQASSPYSFTGLSPAASTWYCATVTDSAATLVTSSVSSSVEVTVNGQLTSGTVAPSAPTIDSGQSVTLSVNPSGGIAPYTYRWYSGSSSACSSDTTALDTASTQSVSPTSSTYYCYAVTDSSTDSPTVFSTTDQVTVDSTLVAGAITPSSPTIDSGQSISLAANPSGGAPAYHYSWWTTSDCSTAPASGSTDSSTYSASTLGTYYYLVTDSASSPSSQCSSGGPVTANPAFTGTAVTVSPSSATTDSGQPVTLTVTWTSAGTSPYSVQLTTSSSASCASPAPLGSPETGLTGTSTTFSVTPTSTALYCATVTDMANSTESASATIASQISVNLALNAPSISTTTPTIDSGQTASFSVSWTSSGTSTYTITLYYSSSAISCTALGSQIDQKTGQPGSPASFSESGLAVGGDYVCATLKDSATSPETTITSTPVTVAVNSVLVAPVISVAPTAIDNGQSSTLSTAASFSGGTSTYTCQWLEALGAGSYSDLGSSFTTGCATASSPTIQTGALTTGTWHFELQVTDSGNPAALVTSNVATVTVNTVLSLSVPGQTLDSGQSTALTATASGGSGSYFTYAFYSGSSCTGTPLQSSSSNTYSTGALAFTATYCVAATDSLGGMASTTATVTVGSVLSVSVSPVTIDSGQTASLTAVPSGGSGGYTYAWHQGAACSGSVLGTSASYTTAALTSATTYCIRVTDSHGGTATATPTVTVNPALVAGGITPSSPSIDTGQSVTLTAHASGGTSPYSYQWYSGTSTTCSSDTTLLGSATSTQSVNPTKNTRYCYSVTDSASSPSSKSSATDLVTVNSALTAAAITPSAPKIDSGQSVTLTAHASGGTSPYTYQWYSGNSATCSSDTTTLGTASTQSASPASSTYYCYEVTDASTGAPNGAPSSTDLVTVNSVLTAGAITSSAPTIDSGQSVTMSSAASGGTSPYTYQWYTGASCTIIVSGQTGAAYSPSPTSTTTYSYKVTDAANSHVSQCSSGDTVTVNPALVAGGITPSSPSIDSGQSVTLTAHASGGTSPYTYQWYSGTSSTCSSDTTALGATSTQSVNPTKNTRYCYSVTDSASSPSSKSSATDLVTVNSALTAGAITPSGPTIIIGNSVTLTAHASGGTSPYSYQWYSGTSTSCSSDTTLLGSATSTQSVNPTVNTYYCYKVSDSSTGTPIAGATSATVQVRVNKATTTTTLTCTSPVTVGTPSTCSVTVTGAYGSTNGETVSFTASGSGTFSSGGTCTLSGGTCSLTYTPTTASGRPQTITATYSGDTNNVGSSDTASIRVTST